MTCIFGTNIYLSNLQISHVNDTYVSWLNDPEVNRYLETRHYPQTFETISSFVEQKNDSKDEYLFGIFLSDSHRHIGNIKIGPINPFHLTADVSLFIGDKPSWGRGFGAEAIFLITKYGFDVLHLHKIKAGCYAINIGSSKAFLKCGFKKEGEFRESALCEGSRINDLIFGVLRDELINPCP